MFLFRENSQQCIDTLEIRASVTIVRVCHNITGDTTLMLEVQLYVGGTPYVVTLGKKSVFWLAQKKRK